MNSLSEIAGVIKQAKKIIVASHYSPDPDAYGSSCGLSLALRALGKEVVTLNQDGILPHFTFIPGVSLVQSEIPSGDWDLVCVVDCGELKRVGDELGQKLLKFPAMINIDHHASNSMFGKYNFVVEASHSTAELVFLLLQELKVKITPEIASCLFCGIASDTGSFRRCAKDGSTLTIAGELVKLGAEPSKLGYELFDKISIGGLKLQGEVLSTTEIFADGKIAQVIIRREMCDKYGVSPEEAKELVTRILGIEGVCVALILREDEPLWRISLRSISAKYDVSLVAQTFGGGGHRQAAAFRSKLPLEQFYPKLKAELEKTVAVK